ncbi:MAG: hypothetical protein GEU83_04355 [Pseudonocardiaceae bacterium]|nr:hypothetical protein [Pseudonocardiaceae bacterium]
MTLGAPPDQEPARLTGWRGLAVLLAVTIALAALSLTVVLAPQVFGTLHREWRNFFDMLKEGNLAAWWSSGLLLITALAHVLVAAAARVARATDAPLWIVSGGVIAGMSIDDHTQLHERSGRIGRALVTYDNFPFYWLIPGLVAGLVVAAALVLLAMRVHRPTRLLLVTGITVLLGCALGLEVVQGFLMAADNEGIAFVLIYHIEELGENVGALMLLAAAVTAVTITRTGGVLDIGYRAGLGQTSNL